MRYRRPLVLSSLLAVAAFALLAAGCGGRGSPGAAGVTSSTTTGAGTQNTAPRLRPLHALARVAEVARPHRRRSVRQVDAAAIGVQRLPGTSRARWCLSSPASERPAPGPVITAADRTDYLKAAACMRTHGYPDFPDPTFQNNTVQANVPSSINQDSSRSSALRSPAPS